MKPSNFSSISSTRSPVPTQPAEATKTSHHVFSDSEWMAIRHLQMDITPNCIFPRREQKSVAQYVQVFRAIIAAAIRLPIKMWAGKGKT